MTGDSQDSFFLCAATDNFPQDALKNERYERCIFPGNLLITPNQSIERYAKHISLFFALSFERLSLIQSDVVFVEDRSELQP